MIDHPVMWNYLICLLLVLVSPSISDDVKSEFKTSFAKNCDTTYSLTCLKLDVVSWVERLNEDDDYSLIPGVSIVRENGSSSENTADIVSNLAREFPNDPEARLDVFLMKKVTGFMNSHSIKLKLWSDSDNEEVETARKRKGGGGGGGGMGYILAAGAMMKGAMMAMALAGLAAIAGKALMAALMSLLLSAIAALKGMGGGGGKTTYEVVAKPVYTSSHSHSQSHEDYGGHGHSGYGRSFSEQPLPLGLQPEFQPDH